MQFAKTLELTESLEEYDKGQDLRMDFDTYKHDIGCCDEFSEAF